MKVKSKAQRKLEDHNKLLGYMGENGSITIQDAAKLDENNVSRAYTLLRELVTLGQAEKHGRGQGGYWSTAGTDYRASDRNETTVLRFAAESTK